MRSWEGRREGEREGECNAISREVYECDSGKEERRGIGRLSRIDRAAPIVENFLTLVSARS